MATKLIKDLPLVETLTDTDAVLIQTDNGTQRASLAQIKEVSKGDRGEKGEKGEKGDSGGVMPSDMVDYMGNQHETLKAKNDADVEWILGEVNTVHYEGQMITATDTIEGRARSAILSGNTKVNLIKNGDVEKTIISDANETRTARYAYNSSAIDAGDYTVHVILTDVVNPLGGAIQIAIDNGWTPKQLTKTTVATDVVLSSTFNVSDSSPKTELTIFFDLDATNVKSATIKQVVMQRGLNQIHDWNYFEGMQSVRMPVLTTTGKNFNTSTMEIGTFQSATGETYNNPNWTRSKDFINLPGGETFVLNETKTGKWFFFYDEDKKLISSVFARNGVFTTPQNTKYIKFCIESTDEVFNYQIEKGSTPTTYEPYKSNILSIDGEYRGIGDVCDTVDCITGEVVECIGEIVFDGSDDESWSRNTTLSNDYETSYFTYKLSDSIRGGAGEITKISDWLPPLGDRNHLTDKEGITCVNDGDFSIRILKTKLESDDVIGLKKLLSVKNLRCQYVLKEKSIKTVDLNNQKVYSYDGTTHYTCSSEEQSLIPTLSIDVPTNLPALVSRQRETIAEQSQTLAEQEEAQNILIESQLSWYEATAPVTLNLTDEVLIPEYIQKLYKLAYERGIRDSSNAIIEQDLRID